MAEIPGVGHPGWSPDFRGLMSRNLRDFALQEPDVRPGTRMSGPMARMSDLWPGCPARRFQIGIGTSKLVWGRNLMILGAKFERFRGGKMGKLGEMLDPLETKQIHGSKSTKSHQTNRSQKILGLFLVGNFRIWGRTQQNKARKRWGGSKFVRNRGS